MSSTIVDFSYVRKESNKVFLRAAEKSKEFPELSYLNTLPCLMLSRIISSASNVAERYTELLLPNHFCFNNQVLFCSREKVVSGIVKC